MRISDWSSDVCSSDLDAARQCLFQGIALQKVVGPILNVREPHALVGIDFVHAVMLGDFAAVHDLPVIGGRQSHFGRHFRVGGHRSEEHTSELQSLMRISYAVFCLKKKIRNTEHGKKHSKYEKNTHSFVSAIRMN